MVASGRKSLKRGQFAPKKAREDRGTVARDRKSLKRGGPATSFNCTTYFDKTQVEQRFVNKEHLQE